MHPYSYAVSLRVWHPSSELEAIGAALGLIPRFAWTAGEPRLTPAGALLSGTRSESYWSASVLPEPKLESETAALEDALAQVVQQLTSSAEFFSRVQTEGGRAELFLGLYGDRNFGFVLPPSLLSQISALGLALSFDVYP